MELLQPDISSLFYFIIPLIAGTGLLWAGMKLFSKKESVTRNGKTAEGVIYEFSSEKRGNAFTPKISFGSYSNWSNTSYNDDESYPVIRFVTEKLEWITEPYYGGIPFCRIGDKVTVLYNPDNPKDFIVAGTTSKILPYIMIGAGVLCLATGLCLAILYLLS